MTSNVRRIALVRLSHLGDVVHALPVFHALAREHPAAEIGWVVQREHAPLLRGLPRLARAFELDRRGGIAAWRALRAELRAWSPDLAVDAQGNWKSAFATRATGAPRKCGMHARDWREGLAAVLVSDRAPRAEGVHAIDRMRALAAHVAPSAGSRELDLSDFDLGLARDELDRARAELDARRGGVPDVVVQLGTPGDPRSWPIERVVELARALDRRGETALIVSGPAEEALGRALEHELRDARAIRHWVGQRGLRELAAVLTVAARAGTPFVGNDSGPMHLAWACGARVVLVAGPQDELRTGPWPTRATDEARHEVVRARERVPCAPCLARACAHAEGPVCTRRVASEDVIAALDRMRAPRGNVARATAGASA